MPSDTAFQVPADPLELTVFLDNLRVRILPFTEELEITAEETEVLRSDYAALNYAVRATEEAEILAGEWLDYQTTLLTGGAAMIRPPAPTVVPCAGSGGAATVREVRGGRYGRVRAGIAPRLQAFVERIVAHPNATDRMLLDLGLLPNTTMGFSSGQASPE